MILETKKLPKGIQDEKRHIVEYIKLLMIVVLHMFGYLRNLKLRLLKYDDLIIISFVTFEGL